MDGKLKQEVEELLSRTSALLSRGGSNSVSFSLQPRGGYQIGESASSRHDASPGAMRASPLTASRLLSSRLSSPLPGSGQGGVGGTAGRAVSGEESLLPSLRRLLSGNLSSPRGSPGSPPRHYSPTSATGGGRSSAAAAARVLSSSSLRRGGFSPPSLRLGADGGEADGSPWLDRPSPSRLSSRADVSEASDISLSTSKMLPDRGASGTVSPMDPVRTLSFASRSTAFTAGPSASMIRRSSLSPRGASPLKKDFLQGPEVRRFNASLESIPGPPGDIPLLESQLEEALSGLSKKMSGWAAVEMDARNKFGRLLRHGLDKAFAKATPVWPPKIRAAIDEISKERGRSGGHRGGSVKSSSKRSPANYHNSDNVRGKSAEEEVEKEEEEEEISVAPRPSPLTHSSEVSEAEEHSSGDASTEVRARLSQKPPLPRCIPHHSSSHKGSASSPSQRPVPGGQRQYPTHPANTYAMGGPAYPATSVWHPGQHHLGAPPTTPPPPTVGPAYHSPGLPPTQKSTPPPPSYWQAQSPSFALPIGVGAPSWGGSVGSGSGFAVQHSPAASPFWPAFTHAPSSHAHAGPLPPLGSLANPRASPSPGSFRNYGADSPIPDIIRALQTPPPSQSHPTTWLQSDPATGTWSPSRSQTSFPPPADHTSPWSAHLAPSSVMMGPTNQPPPSQSSLPSPNHYYNQLPPGHGTPQVVSTFIQPSHGWVAPTGIMYTPALA